VKSFALFFLLAPFISVAAEPLIPTTAGMTWNYEFVQEKPSDSLDLTEPNEEAHFPVTYRLGGSEKIDNKDLRRLELYRGKVLESVDLIAIEERGIICPARSDSRGTITKLIPPQMMLLAPLAKGKRWKFDGKIGETKVVQDYEIAGEEDVDVPAGKFHAWRIHCEQKSPASATIDRWFVVGTGFVKVATMVKGESGEPAEKTWLSLKELPKIESLPQKNAPTESEKLSAGVSTRPQGDFKAEFKQDAQTIYVRWHGRGFRDQAAIRAVFIAENVADVTANYQIDEIETTAPAPNSGGTFALSRPEGGWSPGDYRVEFYLGDTLAETVKFKIVKSSPATR
jgi:hypothetical protein